MVSGNTYTLTKALKDVFIDAHMTDQSNNKSGPSFLGLTRMEEFWEVEKKQRKIEKKIPFFLFNST
jgi:3-deoxy-D-manno-octulosonic acid (KDO) 8-phosphate synthase